MSARYSRRDDLITLSEMRTWQSGLLQMSVHRATKKYSDEYLRKYNLTTMQWLVIGATLDKGENGIRVTDLAETAGTTLSYMTTMLNKLEDMGIVREMIDHSDSRSRRMVVHENYRAVCLQIEEGLRNTFRDNIYNRISRRRLEDYVTTLQMLSDTDPSSDKRADTR